MSLKKFIAQENRINDLFGRSSDMLPGNPKDLTPEQKKALATRLLCALSPENLTCDGELRGAKLRSKAAMLNAAKADLEALGQKVEWEYS